MYLTQVGRENPGRDHAGRVVAPGSERGLAEWWGLGLMAGRSPAMQHLFARMQGTAAHFRLATVEGEAGTGKLLAARTLHRLGPAAGGPFAPYAAVEFLERAELLWKENRGGLVYLARVDELSGERQRQLRKFLGWVARERMRVHAVTGPVQLVAGSAQPLRRLAAGGGFRADLASHLTAIRFALPPLRERREDIPLLAELSLRRWGERYGKRLRGFAPGAMEVLIGYGWPGNVRELESAVSAAALECAEPWVRPIDIPPLDGGGPMSEPRAAELSAEDANLDRAILRHTARVLARAGGNKVRAARMLGISRSTLYRLLDADTASAGSPD